MKLTFLLVAAVVSVLAVPTPRSLVAKWTAADIAEKTAQGLRLLSIEENADPVWKTESELLDLIRAKQGFFDVTETYEEFLELVANQPDVRIQVTYAAPSHTAAVKALIAQASTSSMISYHTPFIAYTNRYYRSTYGAAAQKWLLAQLQTIASGKSGITVTEFTHSWGQNSIIVHINGSGSSTAVTILGAHLDSINLNSPTSGRAPGADDNATGVVTLIETFRVLAANSYVPTTPLEFHFYAGEEGGLLGSQAIVSNYRSAAKSVKAFINFDMTGYYAPGSTQVVALETDYIDTGLNTFLRQCITAYLSIPAGTDYCGYACSDHASWYNGGFPSAMPFEAPTEYENPYIHTTSDVTSVSGFSWTHAFEFTKLAIAAAYELTV